MGWTSPPTFTSGQIVTASDLNVYLRDNTNYLLSGRPVGFTKRASTYSSNSTTFVDVDATNLILTVTLSGSRCTVFVTTSLFASNVATNYGCLDVIVDSTSRAGDATWGLFSSGQNFTTGAAFPAYFSGLSAGVHTFKLQYRCQAGAATVQIAAGGVNATPVTTMLAVEY